MSTNTLQEQVMAPQHKAARADTDTACQTVMAQRAYTAWQVLLRGQRLPAAILDLDALDQNIQALARRANGKPIRIATKSIRCTSVIRHIQQSGVPLQGLLCYSAEEAAWLASQGFDDLLVAYPTINTDGIQKVCLAVKQGARITLMADDEAQLSALQHLAAAQRCTLPIAFDLDLSFNLPGLRFGVFRSPLDSPDKVQALFRSLPRFPSLRLDGAMGYEAQIAGVGDNTPGKNLENQLIRALKRWAIPKIATRRAAMIAALQQSGAELRFVNGGGTGSVESTILEPHITDVAIGSGFYQPALFDHYQTFRHTPALFFALEVARKQHAESITCLGGGYIASGSVSAHKLPQPYSPEGLQYHPNEGAGEVQTPLFGKTAAALKPGDPAIFRHAKAGELCERFNTLLVVRQGQIVDEWPTYRGEGQCFE
ncbi:D-serine deaminase-like pyridoxal phosphate-dependent protein [Chitinivorax tropicus]|uniref:D-serine deaminase-like pyridoxal phosphate-dependent protein n=1 Tax=Chitinivorax tropicus TaxID=714531 RepID=A0A840MMF0_9PROT|nr:amino acid deaminase/aldolase [Chitinivorax tropicus]MBB5019808.1 D-serine deaminase-like pyridoxal phosphate-dependent protein [Chitinivorax tropicus]